MLHSNPLCLHAAKIKFNSCFSWLTEREIVGLAPFKGAVQRCAEEMKVAAFDELNTDTGAHSSVRSLIKWGNGGILLAPH